MKTKLITPIIVFLLFAALAIPVSASAESGLANDDPLVESEGHYIPGYGIDAYTISLTARPDEIPADGKSKSTITAQLMDRKGKKAKIAYVKINFDTNKGTLSADSATTDRNGIATITLKSNKKIGNANIKASSDSVLKPGRTNVKFTKDHHDKEKDDDKDKEKDDRDKENEPIVRLLVDY